MTATIKATRASTTSASTKTNNPIPIWIHIEHEPVHAPAPDDVFLQVAPQDAEIVGVSLLECRAKRSVLDKRRPQEEKPRTSLDEPDKSPIRFALHGSRRVYGVTQFQKALNL